MIITTSVMGWYGVLSDPKAERRDLRLDKKPWS